MVRDYGYYKQLLNQIKQGKPLSIERINKFGGRMSSKTFSAVDFFILACLLKKCKVYGFRYMNDDKKELFKQILANIENFPGLSDIVSVHLTDKTITFPNGSIIEIKGLHKQKNDDVKLTGLSGAIGYDYGIAFAEERYEISDKEWSAVLQAIRGFDNFLEIHAANPWIFTNDYVTYCHNKMPFDLVKLKQDGQQYKIHKEKVIDEDLGIDTELIEVLHYSNFSINHYLTNADKNKLAQAARHDPHRANTILYGYPGIPEGSIWKHVLDKMFREYDKSKIVNYSGGVDYGEKGDATAAYVVGFEKNYEHAHIEHEYYWANKKGTIEFRDTIKLTKDVVEHFIDFYEEHDLQGILNIEVDSAAIPFITALNNMSDEYGYGEYIKFLQCKKYKVAERIEQLRTMASFGMITIDESCTNARREYQEATYSKKLSEYRDGDDHSQDTIEYGLAAKWVDLLDALEMHKQEELDEI